MSHREALAAIQRWPNGAPAAAQGRQPGLLMAGMDAVWLNTVDRRIFDYIQSAAGQIVGPDGAIDAGKTDANRGEDALLGRQLLLLYGVTRDRRYFTAATELYRRMIASSGAVQTPDQAAWAAPFLAGYAAAFHQPRALAGIAAKLMQAGARGGAEPVRAMAWTMGSLVDALPFYGEYGSERDQLIGLLARDAVQAAQRQDAKTGLWLAPAGETAKSAADLTASCLMVYALAKGVRLGYLPQSDLAPAHRAYKSILRDGIPAGTVEEVGAFLLAGAEMENAANAQLGRGRKVVVDAWFNSQMHPDPTGRQIYFHYKWDDQSNDGFSLLGHIFRNFGARTGTLYVAPTAANLRHAQVYIVVSPDIPAKNPRPHYAQPEDGAQLAAWVRGGGVLVLLANDPANTDLTGLNRIAGQFGIHFNSVLRKHVLGQQYGAGKIVVEGNGPIFHRPHTLFMKDVCSIAVTAPAVSVLGENGETWMAVAKYGKGTVYANVDPWLYNEYIDGRKLPAIYDNYAAGVELVRWILEQIPHVPAAKITAVSGDPPAPARR